MTTDVVKLQAKCNIMLEALVGEHLVDKWWESPNKAFKNQQPKEYWKENPQAIFNYLVSLSMGDCY